MTEQEMKQEEPDSGNHPDEPWQYSDDGTFRWLPPNPTYHNGKPYMLVECAEWVEGRWEGFVAMHPLKEQRA